MEENFEQYLMNFDNCKNLENLNFVKEESRATIEHFWIDLLQTQFTDQNLSVFFETLNEGDRAEYFKFGVSCIVSFVQANFTGPELSSSFSDFFGAKLFGSFNFKLWLSADEELNVNTKYPALLVAAQCMFKHCNWHGTLNPWWYWRSLMVHQRVLDELSPNILETVKQLHKQLQNIDLKPQLKALLEIEQAQLFQIYRNVTKSEAHLNKARELLRIKHELAGGLGKRTKYQTNDVAQLRLSVHIDETPEVIVELPIPKNLALDDDLRLETVKFSSEIDSPQLSDLQQKYLIATVQHMQISQPRDNLYYEEIKPFFDYILNQNNTWAVRVMVLLMRCKLESTHKRTIERCLLQCEDVVNCLKKDRPHALNRVGGVYSTNFPPLWEIESQLADLMLNTGLIKGSLDIYLRLELWEEVIVCYTLLKLRHKAAEVIQQRLEMKPTVKLWCLLGDATDDVTCYEKAWEMSGQRSSRAQKHWGEYFYFHKKYQECIPHFETSLSINPLQVNIWLRYGFACLEVENWRDAATAYKRYTMLEPGNFQVWNNLAKAYVKLGNKHAAHQALLDAIKFNFDNWKVWDNLMVVSVDTQNFSDVVNAYHRILDLKEKHLDLEVLQPLVIHLVSNREESNPLLKKTRELFGRLTSAYPVEGFLWDLYAELAPDKITRIQRLQRAYRGLTQVGWEKSVEKCQEALFVCTKLGDLILKDDIKPNDPIIHNVRLNLGSCVAAVTRQNFEKTPENFEEVSKLVQLVTDKCKLGQSL